MSASVKEMGETLSGYKGNLEQWVTQPFVH